MDAIGYLFDAVAYFVITVGAVAAVVWHVDEKVAVPGAAPWRMQAPKVLAVVGPMLFILILPVVLAGLPTWVATGLLIGSLFAPWIGGVLIAIEWLRRRAEDLVMGLARPSRPPTWS